MMRIRSSDKIHLKIVIDDIYAYSHKDIHRSISVHVHYSIE